jgi:predicted ATPase
LANADLERFRLKLREYRLLVNRNQGDMAVYLDLDYSDLSNRLNDHKNARLSHDNVHNLVRALAEWGAIVTRFQAEELLDLMLCPHFGQADWQAKPLSKLSSSPPLSSIPAIPAPYPSASYPVHNLPQTLNPLLGRRRELTQLLEILTTSKTRLVTLTGAGGSGKTSLALEVGKQLTPSFSNGVYFVRLENVSRRESLISEIAGTLKLKEATGQKLLTSLKEYLKEKAFLLILDNFEQLVAEAAVLVELLRETNHLKLLVTSRIPLQLSFEREFPVGPLALPDKEAVASGEPGKLSEEYAGLALFLERAQAVKPDFSLSQDNIQAVVEICHRLDGLPLALELAAARIRTFSPHKLLERLSLKVLTGGARDLPARQQTLRDTIAWSYDLLGEVEQRFFARLAIFEGGCTLEAAEEICSPDGELTIEVFEGVETLLARNFLKQWQGVDGETRYGMLVTIREFGLEKLVGSGEAGTLRQRYTAYYLALGRQSEPHRSGASGSRDKQLHRVESEYINYRALLFQSLEEGKAEEALGFCVILGDYFVSRGYPGEGLRLLEQALALPYSPDSSPTAKPLRAKALYVASLFIGTLGDNVKARRYIEEVLVLQRELNDKGGIIFSLNRLVPFYLFQGKAAIADRYMAESLALSLELNDEDHLANTRSTLGQAALIKENNAEARRWLQENIEMCNRSGNKWEKAISLHHLSLGEVFQGKYEEAQDIAGQSLDLFQELGLNWGISITLNLMGGIATNKEEYTQAETYSKEALKMTREFSWKDGIATSLFMLGSNVLCEGNMAKARSYLEESLVIHREQGNRVLQALVLPFLGQTAAIQGEVGEARRLFEESLAISHDLGNKHYTAQSLTGLAGLCIQDWLKLEKQASLSSLTALVRVVRLSGAISAMLASIGAVMLRPFPLIYEQNLALARTNLDEVTFEGAFAQGQELLMDVSNLRHIMDEI